MAHRLAWVGVLGLAGCGEATHAKASGLRWLDERVELGELTAGTKITHEAAWEVGTRPIEILRVQHSCGCTAATLWRKGVEIGPGPLPAGARGTARIEVRGEGEPGPKHVSLDLTWRPVGSPRPEVARVLLHAQLRQVFEVTPRLVESPEAAPGSMVPFAITWRSLDQTAKGQLGGHEALPFLRMHSLREQRTPEGQIEVVAEGEIHATEPDTRLVAGAIRILGFEPPLPAVPVKVLFRPFVELQPIGILELKRSGSGTVAATATLVFAPAVQDARVVAVEVLPESVRERLTAGVHSVAPGTWEIRVSGSVPSDLRQETGSVRIQCDRAEIRELTVRWMYLKPRVRP